MTAWRQGRMPGKEIGTTVIRNAGLPETKKPAGVKSIGYDEAWKSSIVGPGILKASMNHDTFRKHAL